MSLRLMPVTVLTAAALAVGGCGGGGDSSTATSARAVTADGSVQPVVDAASKTAAQRSAQITLHGVTKVAGRQIPVDGSGAFDLKARQGHFAATTRVAGQALKLDEITNGQDVFLRTDALSGRLPGGKTWVKIDLAQVGKAAGLDLSSLQSLGNADPAQFLAYLKQAGDVRKVGRARVNGTETTRYAGTIELAKAAKATGVDAERALRQLKQLTGVDRVPVEVWIGDDGLVRRGRIAVDEHGSGGAGRLDLTVDFTRFGVRVDATAPPAGDVFDASNLAKALGGG
jgi:hypothetical protein